MTRTTVTAQAGQTEAGGEPDRSFKYVMMDTGSLYLGARFSYQELLAEEMVPFKLKAVISHYLLKDASPETTLESQLYYLSGGNFLYETLQQLRIKAKINLPVIKKGRELYQEKILPLGELVQLEPKEKAAQGIIIREVIVSRMSLMLFSV